MQHIIVIGAGVIGAWIALFLQKRGCSVRLIDSWGAGNSRASSGGESRMLRGVYGTDKRYVQMVKESLAHWQAFEKAQNVKIYQPTGCLWLFEHSDDAYARKAMPLLNQQGLPMEELPLTIAKEEYPSINFDGIQSIFIEKIAGSLQARFACRQLVKAFVEAGGSYQHAKAKPGKIQAGQMQAVELSNGNRLIADQYVFACGPWLPQLFPALLSQHIYLSRQEVYYFGIPPGYTTNLPNWLNLSGSDIFYGIPNTAGRGFKIANDKRGASLDPNTADRQPSPEAVAEARNFLAKRFPELAQAPLVESRVCQYTNSPDGHYVIDQHPLAANTWLAGVGCGHAFKMGPALGKYVADLVSDKAPVLDRFSLSRLDKIAGRSTQFEHHT